MARCPNCSYELVLLQRNRKCKCAVCGKLYPQKEVENREFREQNKRERVADIDNIKREHKERMAEMRKLRIAIRQMFNGLPKGPKKYSKDYYRQKKREWRLKNGEKDLNSKREYYRKNKDRFSRRAKLRKLNNLEKYKENQQRWIRNNPEMSRTCTMLNEYRKKQKALALLYLRNSDYSLPSDHIFHSVPTYGLSYLLLIALLQPKIIPLNQLKTYKGRVIPYTIWG
ncbi:MAG: hypothetical protein ABIH53_00385 [archaeon]